MKQTVIEFFSPDFVYLVEVRRRQDGLYEIEGYRQRDGVVPKSEEMIYHYLIPASAPTLTDTLSNAEKIAQETLMALSGNSSDNAFGKIIAHGDVIPQVEPGLIKPLDASVVPPELTDTDHRDKSRWNTDEDYKPERNPSLAAKDLIPKVERVLKKIEKGEKSVHSVEVCLLLILLGRSLEQKRKYTDACRFWYNASKIANNPGLGGWGVVADEYYRELRRKWNISKNQYEIEVPVSELLKEFIRICRI